MGDLQPGKGRGTAREARLPVQWPVCVSQCPRRPPPHPRGRAFCRLGQILAPFIYSTVKKLFVTTFLVATQPLPQRLKQRPEIYGLARKRTDAYLAAKRQQDQQQQQGKQ